MDGYSIPAKPSKQNVTSLTWGEWDCWWHEYWVWHSGDDDDDGYYFNDPYEDHGVVYYPKQLVEERHRAQYGMAVGVCRNRSIIDK